ncbi:MAG: hypothetical protein Kow0069_21110 [Promethearchaeota archaeon]
MTLAEESLRESAERGWLLAMRDFHHPPVADPRFVFEQNKDVTFYITPDDDWRVTLNLLAAPPFTGTELVDFFRSISQHELGHYDICPYDGLMAAELLSAAMKHVSKYHAPMVVNFFADLIIDTHLFERFPGLTADRLESLVKEVLHQGGPTEISRFWKALVRCYELAWKIDLGASGMGVRFDDVEAISKKIAEEVKGVRRDPSKWPAGVSRVAQLLKELLEDECYLSFTPRRGKNGNKGYSGEPSEFEGIQVEIPRDVAQTFGDVTELNHRDSKKKNLDPEEQAKRREKAEEFARDKSFGDFGSPAVLAGLIEPEEAMATWYRGRAKGMIDVRVVVERPGGLLPMHPLTWRLGDPLEELDVAQSLHVSPVLIPNMTTRRWHREVGPGTKTEIQPPDLLLVIDSSGSMSWQPEAGKGRGAYHKALLAAFACLCFARERGRHVASINFSDVPLVTPWGVDYEAVERNLLAYQRGGTEVPVQELAKLVEQSGTQSLVVLITDFGLYNFQEAFECFRHILELGHKIVAFFIGGNEKDLENDEVADLISRGAAFYVVRKISELVGLVIEEVRKFYDPAERDRA